MTFPSADQARFALPLSLLGNDDGRLAFELTAWQCADLAGRTQSIGELDYMPNLRDTPGLTR